MFVVGDRVVMNNIDPDEGPTIPVGYVGTVVEVNDDLDEDGEPAYYITVNWDEKYSNQEILVTTCYREIYCDDLDDYVTYPNVYDVPINCLAFVAKDPQYKYNKIVDKIKSLERKKATGRLQTKKRKSVLSTVAKLESKELYKKAGKVDTVNPSVTQYQDVINELQSIFGAGNLSIVSGALYGISNR